MLSAVGIRNMTLCHFAERFPANAEAARRHRHQDKGAGNEGPNNNGIAVPRAAYPAVCRSDWHAPRELMGSVTNENYYVLSPTP